MKVTALRQVWLAALTVSLALCAIAQTPETSPTRAIANGQKATVKGILVETQNEQTFAVRDQTGATTWVVLEPTSSIKTKGGVFSSGQTVSPAQLVRGLYLEVEGRGDAQGRLVARKVRFSKSEYRVAQSLEARVDPVETRVTTTETRVTSVEETARRASGQLDELVAVSNAARGGAKAAQETADLAVAGVEATNERIGDIDNYVMESSTTLNFRNGSAALSPEAKERLDKIAQQARLAKGYIIEITGYTDSVGNPDRNRALSQRRAEAAIRYLLDNHQIPLRRIVPAYGFGENETKAVADNQSREGRAQNRRVEVVIMVSKGLAQAAPEMKPALPPDNPPQQ